MYTCYSTPNKSKIMYKRRGAKVAKRAVIPLSDTTIKNAKSRDKDYLLADGNGLYLNIKTIGTKVWTIRYTIDSAAKKSSIGNYPKVSLAEAREKNKEYQSKAKQGICPITERKEAKENQTQDIEGQIHLVMQSYLERIRSSIVKSTFDHTKRRLERDILPFFCTFSPNTQCTFEDVIVSKHIKDIKHNDLLKAVLAIEARGAKVTAHRVLAECNRLWLYAVQHGYAENNVIANIDKRHALQKVTKGRLPSTTDPKELRRFMEFAEGFNRSYVARYAMRLLPYVFLRAGNINELEWSEVDFDKKTINIKADKMKISANGDFTLPIPQKAIDIINEIRPFTDHCKYVFASSQNPNKPISDGTLSKALRENGFAGIITPHGFRATFSSIAHENTHIHGLSEKVIEACLHHAERNKVAGAYNYHANYLPQMTILINWWADYLDSIKVGG